MFDNNLFLRTTGDGSLTATETATSVAINGTPAKGLALVVGVPKQSVGDTLQVDLQHSTDDSTFTRLLSFETLASVTEAVTQGIKLVRRFATELKYVKTVITVLGTSPDFGGVYVAIGNEDQWNTLTVGEQTDPDGGTV